MRKMKLLSFLLHEKSTKSMVIEFKKIPTSGTHFETVLGDICFKGEAKKVSKNLVECCGSMQGNLHYICDRCAEEFDLHINENVDVFASEGFYEDKEGEALLNVVEFFDGNIDFTALFKSELEAFKSDYHYCGHCQHLE